MSDDTVQRTTMTLDAETRDRLDELAHSRSEAVRKLVAEHDAAHPAEADPDPDDRCPECGRPVALEAAGGSLSVRSADDDVVDYCRSSGAADWLYLHV